MIPFVSDKNKQVIYQSRCIPETGVCGTGGNEGSLKTSEPEVGPDFHGRER